MEKRSTEQLDQLIESSIPVMLAEEHGLGGCECDHQAATGPKGGVSLRSLPGVPWRCLSMARIRRTDDRAGRIRIRAFDEAFEFRQGALRHPAQEFVQVIGISRAGVVCSIVHRFGTYQRTPVRQAGVGGHGEEGDLFDGACLAAADVLSTLGGREGLGACQDRSHDNKLRDVADAKAHIGLRSAFGSAGVMTPGLAPCVKRSIRRKLHFPADVARFLQNTWRLSL